MRQFFKILLKKMIPATRNLVIYKTDLLLEKIDSIRKSNDQSENQLNRIYQQIELNSEEANILMKQQLDTQKALLEETNAQVDQFGLEIRTVYENMQEGMESYIDQIRMEILPRIEKVEATVKNTAHQWLYDCPHEIRAIEEGGFLEYRQRVDYVEQYQQLVQGLDQESIATINQILSRHQIVCGHSGEAFDLFTMQEQEIITSLHRKFYAEMPEIAPGIFACGEYLLASPQKGMGYAETTVFKDLIGFHKLKYPERIRDKDILDLGAFIGDSALVLSKYTDEKVYAFEPGNENFRAMEKTLQLNHCNNIVPVHMGIGSRKSGGKIEDSFSMGLTVREDRNQKTDASWNNIKLISVDEFVEEKNISVGLIKVDIEGYEQEFLKGAKKTISEQKPALLLSMYHNASDFFQLKSILESWQLGYRFRVHKEINEHIHYDTMLIAEIEKQDDKGVAACGLKQY